VQRPPLLPAPSIFACTLSPPSLHAFPPPLGHALSCPGFARRVKTPVSFLINLHPTPSSPRAPRLRVRPSDAVSLRASPGHDEARPSMMVEGSNCFPFAPPSLHAFPLHLCLHSPHSFGMANSATCRPQLIRSDGRRLAVRHPFKSPPGIAASASNPASSAQWISSPSATRHASQMSRRQ